MTAEALPVADIEEPPVPAEESPPVEAPISEPPAIDEDALAALLKEHNLEAAEESSSPEQKQQTWLDKLPEEDRKQAQQELEEARNLKARIDESQKQGQARAFANRIGILDRTFQEVFGGQREFNPQLAGWVLEQFKAHNGDATAFAAQPFSETMLRSMAEKLPSAEREGFLEQHFTSTPAAITEFVTLARKGYITESKAKAQAAQAAKDIIIDLQTHPEKLAALVSKTKAPGLNGAGSAGEVTYAQILKMTPAQVQALPSDVYNRAVEQG